MGVYSIHWILQALPPGFKHPNKVYSVTSKYSATGVDESTTIVMTFAVGHSNESSIIAVASCSLSAGGDYDKKTPTMRIQGDKGEIQIFGRPWCPEKILVWARDQGHDEQGSLIHQFDNVIIQNVHGLCLEADEAARCINSGKVQSEIMPWAESLTVMEILDRVREESGLRFPGEIESVQYPRTLPTARRCIN